MKQHLANFTIENPTWWNQLDYLPNIYALVDLLFLCICHHRMIAHGEEVTGRRSKKLEKCASVCQSDDWQQQIGIVFILA